MKISHFLILVTLTLPFSLSAGSNDLADEKQLLLESCMSLKKAPEEVSANSCVYYIQGFLAGSATTGTNYVFRETSGEFLDRAYQTRVGKRTSKEQLIQLCIPKNEDVDHLIARLVEHLSYPIESMQLLHTQIYQALAVESSCS